MTEVVKVYMESVSQGVTPDPESEEAKEYRAWSWAQEQIAAIKEGFQSDAWDRWEMEQRVQTRREEIWADCRVIDWN